MSQYAESLSQYVVSLLLDSKRLGYDLNMCTIGCTMVIVNKV